ncbi:S8 family peptidase [Streptomyces sp. AJS327]|uniref:S8 family peptidase n=1 Tax=Streptomyces sp. AJS327 TaxID=2545265 RepID=UPI0015DE868E|nr:S8 family peptidase [Streptomyces sp. AJS327]MBA0052078.1 S8 family peptidase [Streptomyces sp. AJS327]
MATPMPRKRRISIAVGAAIAVAGGATLLTLPAGASPAEGTVYGTNAKGAIDGSYVVMLKDEKGVKATSSGKELTEEYGGKVKHTYSSAVNGFSAKGLSEQEAKELAADDKVEKVVQNKRFTINATQDNPPSWGLDRIDQEETAGDDAYTYPDTAGEGVTAYIIDTGVRITHQDFEDRAEHGYDAVDDDNEADDGQGHGTHVAGTVAGKDHGVAKKAKIVAVRVLDDQGSGTTEQVVKGIDWVTENASGPSVANMSLGGPQDEALDAAVKKSIEAGVSYSVAAGNEGQDADASSPARVPEAMTVAASDDADAQASFSNHGEIVDLYAPGVKITSATNTGDDATETLDGTSMAAPHVAGAAAVYLSANQDATPEQVSTALTDGATQDAITNPTGSTPNKLLKVGE